MLDGATIVKFVHDEEGFDESIQGRFLKLDTNNDCLLLYDEMLAELWSSGVFECHYGFDVKTDLDEVCLCNACAV